MESYNSSKKRTSIKRKRKSRTDSRSAITCPALEENTHEVSVETCGITTDPLGMCSRSKLTAAKSTSEIYCIINSTPEAEKSNSRKRKRTLKAVTEMCRVVTNLVPQTDLPRTKDTPKKYYPLTSAPFNTPTAATSKEKDGQKPVAVKDHVPINSTIGSCSSFANSKLRRYNSSTKLATDVYCTNVNSLTEPIIGSLKSTPRKRKRTPNPMVETWSTFGRNPTTASYINSSKRKRFAEYTTEIRHNTSSPETVPSVKSTRRQYKGNAKAGRKPCRAPAVRTLELCCSLPDLSPEPCCHFPEHGQGPCCPTLNPTLKPRCFPLDPAPGSCCFSLGITPELRCFPLDPAPGSCCFSLGITPEPSLFSLDPALEPTSSPLNRPKSLRCLSPNPTLVPCYFSPEPTQEHNCTSLSPCYNSANPASEFYCLFITSVSETYYLCLNRALELCYISTNSLPKIHHLSLKPALELCTYINGALQVFSISPNSVQSPSCFSPKLPMEPWFTITNPIQKKHPASSTSNTVQRKNNSSAKFLSVNPNATSKPTPKECNKCEAHCKDRRFITETPYTAPVTDLVTQSRCPSRYQIPSHIPLRPDTVKCRTSPSLGQVTHHISLWPSTVTCSIIPGPNTVKYSTSSSLSEMRYNSMNAAAEKCFTSPKFLPKIFGTSPKTTAKISRTFYKILPKTFLTSAKPTPKAFFISPNGMRTAFFHLLKSTLGSSFMLPKPITDAACTFPNSTRNSFLNQTSGKLSAEQITFLGTQDCVSKSCTGDNDKWEDKPSEF